MKFDFNQIITYFNNLNSQARYAVFAAVVFLVILLDVFLLVLPQIGGIADIHSQIKQISQDTQEVSVDRQRLNQLRKNLQLTRDQLSSLSGRVRPVQEVPSILSTISSMANDNGVKIDQLMPEKNQQQVLTTVGGAKYYALPIEIKARCGYHMFGRFLNGLENQDMYFIMKDFIIQNEAKDTGTRLFSLTIKVILVDQNPEPASKSL